MLGWPHGWRHEEDEKSYKVFLGSCLIAVSTHLSLSKQIYYIIDGQLAIFCHVFINMRFNINKKPGSLKAYVCVSVCMLRNVTEPLAVLMW